MTGTSTPKRARMAGPDRLRGRDRGRPAAASRPNRTPGPTFEASIAAVGADEPVRGLGDQDAVLHPDDAPGLAQHDLDLARVAVAPRGELDGLGSRLDGGQVDDGALGLRHDLLGDDEDVVARSAAARPRVRSMASPIRDGRGRRRRGSRGCRRARGRGSEPSAGTGALRLDRLRRRRGRSGVSRSIDQRAVRARCRWRRRPRRRLDGRAGCPARTRSR